MYNISFLHAEGPVAAEVWIDARHRLLRVSIPHVAVELVRDDIASVGTRVRALTHAGDETVSVRSEGFGLAATVTTPVERPQPADGWPAVLLVSGPGAPDRDGTFSDVPVFGQLAAALADAGFLVARYDRRGTGQSGGRPESAGSRSTPKTRAGWCAIWTIGTTWTGIASRWSGTRRADGRRCSPPRGNGGPTTWC